MGKDELVHEIGMMLLRDSEIASLPWRNLVIVAQLMPTSTKVNGFAYQSSGKAIPCSPGDTRILKKFKELREAMTGANAQTWKACVTRIDKESKEVKMEFEYDHPEKWQITPSTVEQMAETLRVI